MNLAALFLRIEDAVSATRAAIEEGTVAGGGVALIRAEEAIEVPWTRPVLLPKAR